MYPSGETFSSLWGCTCPGLTWIYPNETTRCTKIDETVQKWNKTKIMNLLTQRKGAQTPNLVACSTRARQSMAQSRLRHLKLGQRYPIESELPEWSKNRSDFTHDDLSFHLVRQTSYAGLHRSRPFTLPRMQILDRIRMQIDGLRWVEHIPSSVGGMLSTIL